MGERPGQAAGISFQGLDGGCRPLAASSTICSPVNRPEFSRPDPDRDRT